MISTPIPTMIRMTASRRFIRPPATAGCGAGGFAAVVVVGTSVAVVTVVSAGAAELVVGGGVGGGATGCGTGAGDGAGTGAGAGTTGAGAGTTGAGAGTTGAGAGAGSTCRGIGGAGFASAIFVLGFRCEGFGFVKAGFGLCRGARPRAPAGGTPAATLGFGTTFGCGASTILVGVRTPRRARGREASAVRNWRVSRVG